MRVLAMTCSTRRPVLLRHCLLQMQVQTVAVDHAVYINAAADDDYAACLYEDLLADIRPHATRRLWVAQGPTLSQHRNHMAALTLAPWRDYDLVLKIDDDDIYRANYVADCVADFEAHRWDLSGSHSEGLINGHRWHAQTRLTDLGMQAEDIRCGVPKMMPSTYAFSAKGIAFIHDVFDDIHGWEDARWRQAIARDPALRVHVRERSNFTFNVHGANVSVANHLEP